MRVKRFAQCVPVCVCVFASVCVCYLCVLREQRQGTLEQRASHQMWPMLRFNGRLEFEEYLSGARCVHKNTDRGWRESKRDTLKAILNAMCKDTVHVEQRRAFLNWVFNK